LPPSCTRLFDETGIRHTMERAGFVRPAGNTVPGAFPDVLGVIVDVGRRNLPGVSFAVANVSGIAARRVLTTGE
jgi:hypothetical protein